jgi:flagellar basal body-associated protein FliL
MPLLPCPECGKKLKVRDDIEPGKRVRCKDCGEMFRVPEEDDEDEEDEEETPRPRKKASRSEDEEDEDRPSRRARRSDDDDEEDEEEDKRPRKPQKKPKKKKKGSKAGLIIVLSIVGVLLIAVGVVVAVGVSKGWFSKGDSSTASTKDSSSSKDKDGSKNPPPVQATGEVKAIPRNFVDQAVPFGAQKGMTLAEVEAKLGGAGKRMAGAELDEVFREMAAMRDTYNGFPGCTCYRWTSGRTKMILLFPAGGGQAIGGQVNLK